ncbi:MAG: prepilin-type N-terminal cleavage/methylation domain-containing protein [Lentisphaeria bacterium]|nr:prepilin-type N-terminal cleavage/methylation domain-containing protein [Lentisphaeria bacterium]
MKNASNVSLPVRDEQVNLRRFTLIELLVVIAIIAILAAILMPALSAARERSRSATCTSNQKNVMMAVAGYAEDYSGYVYAAYKDATSVITAFSYDPDSTDKTAAFSYSAMLVRRKYLPGANKVNSPLFCPSSVQTIPEQAPDKVLQYSYGASYATASPEKNKNYFAHNTRLGHIAGHASAIAFLADTADINKKVPSHIFHHKVDTGKTDHGSIFYLHNGRANVAFIDGHCEAVQPKVPYYLLRVKSAGEQYILESGLEGTPGAPTSITGFGKLPELKQ